jgi:hypothetical protein
VRPSGQSFLGGSELYGCAEVFCNLSETDAGSFALEAAATSLTPFLSPGGVDAALASDILVSATILEALQSRLLVGEFTWSGTMSLTYDYEQAVTPPGVPEPATWIAMLVGFGATGAVLRRRGPGSSLAASPEK